MVLKHETSVHFFNVLKKPLTINVKMEQKSTPFLWSIDELLGKLGALD